MIGAHRLFPLLSLACVVSLAFPRICAAAGRIVLPADVTPVRYEISIVPDAAHLTFAGDERVTIDVHRRTRSVTLNAADLSFRSVALSNVPGAPRLSFDSAQETATLHFAAPVPAGRHVLRIVYAGKINENAAGLFALDYDTVRGKHRALYTQFENSDARRFMPSWDEPAQKAVFSLSAVVPADLTAVSNMPVSQSRSLPDGKKLVAFAPSPQMSTYLLFFALGDFERLSRQVNGIDVGVVVKRGDRAKATFALGAAAQILPYYEDYFGVTYPLPKLDLIAGPGESEFFGAMENWGAIFFFERALLIDPAIATAESRRNVYITIAHEMSHQWFGDLVTMQWWDDIWLNEGFASWMELKATDHFHPEWQAWLDALDSKEAAMEVDARAGTHPVIQPIRDVFQANEAFDAITYDKGRAIVRMIENYLGADAFRDGIRRYIKAYAYRNTVSDDLWHALQASTSSPVTPVAHDFTLQPGVPLIRGNLEPNRLQLSQDRYIENDPDRSARSWRVPVIENSLDGRHTWRGIVTRNAPAEITVSPGAKVIVNSGQGGYFRTLYSAAELSAIVANFAALSPSDQMGILNDTRALGLSGYEPVADYASLVTRVSPKLEPLVLRTVAAQLEDLDRLYDGLPKQAQYRTFARKILLPFFARAGWDARRPEGANVPVLRQALLGALGELDDPTVVAETRRRFQFYARDRRALSPDERQSVLSIVSENADPATWSELRELARETKSSLEKREFYEYLGRARDPELAKRNLQLSLSDEVPITTRPTILKSVGAEHPDLALAFLTSHFDAFNRAIEPDSRAEFAPDIVESSNDARTIAALRDFARAHIPPNARGDEIRAEAAIAYNAQVRRERLPELDRWIAAHS
ncbi:MAG TPA: M1 family metallopeptidase [Rhizomicrobium sp.]|jgi:aminopeptidase N|nr:M1 family metallopeptidase [Rhizomicrobium sp.]